MRKIITAIAVSAAAHASAFAAETLLTYQPENGTLLMQILGDKDDDWRLQTSSDLYTWNDLPSFGTILSDSPARSLGIPTETQRFYRAAKTDGLYDTSLLRTVSLTFAQSNWQNLLTSARSSGQNVLCNLSLDNGAAITGAGARYKGNTSFNMGGAKKSVNIEMDFTNPAGDLMGYQTINLNNAAGDETILREPIYFSVMAKYAVSPTGSVARLMINGDYWGAYSLAEQENSDLIKKYFPSSNGDRWRAPNIGGGAGGGRPPGGGGGFGGAGSALSYLGATMASYQGAYELKTDNSPEAWNRLVHAIDVLNNTPADQFPDKVQDVLAVDRWLWFLAVENIFADDDSYFNKGADYGFYYEPESGRIHPIEHDGNESFTSGDVNLSPVQGSTGTNRPVISKLLGVPEFRQRYLAHMRTVLTEAWNPTVMNVLIDRWSALSREAIAADPKKNFTMTAYNSDLAALKSFIQRRHAYLTTHDELTPMPPNILAVQGPAVEPIAGETPFVTAKVVANGANGIASVWLYHRGKSYGRFASGPMLDDGAHGDGQIGDDVYGAVIASYPAGTKVRYYVEARSADAGQAASYFPARAEEETASFRVALAAADKTPVVINEVMASNTATLADPQGEFDDWIELRNITDQEVDLTGRYLSDEPNNPRKWAFPAGTKIAPDGYLLVWADEDTTETVGLHASFKLSAASDELFLTDTDANFNAVLDSIRYSGQETDRSYGRAVDNADTWAASGPTPGQPNQ